MPIRRASTADLPKLLVIDGGKQRDPTHPAWLRRAVTERSTWKLVIAGKIVAYGVFRRSFFDRWFVESLYVAADQRRSGRGTLLLKFFEARVKSPGEIWTSTNRSNRPMRTLLRRRV
jgi:GNAT superfamily N-acetyltransferase